MSTPNAKEADKGGPPSLQNLTRSELLDAIKTAITAIESKKKNAGYTTWILVAAIGSLTWALLGQLEGDTNWQQGLAALLVCSLLLKLQDPVHRLLEPVSPRFRRDVRFLPLSILAAHRTEIAATVVQDSLLLLAAIYLEKCSFPIWGAVIYFAWQVFTDLIGLVCSSWDFDFPTGPLFNRAPAGAWVAVIWVCITVVAIVACASLQLVDFGSLRVGLLAAAILHCFVWLGKTATPSPFLAPLLQLQEDFSFGRITQEEAHRLADTTLAGHYFEELLRRRVLPVINSVENLKSSAVCQK